MPYALADKRCKDFGTCGPGGDLTTSTSKVNRKLLAHFETAQGLLRTGQCQEVRPVLNSVIQQMTIPLIQGTLRYAYKVGKKGPGGDNTLANGGAKESAEGHAFAFALLPLIAECNADAGKTIYDNMKLSAVGNVNKDVVKAKLESVYGCLGVTCAEVGALNVDGGCDERDVGGWCSMCVDPATSALSSSKDDKMPVGGLVAIIVAATIALLMCCCMCFLIRKEQAGEPVFTKMQAPAAPAVELAKGAAQA